MILAKPDYNVYRSECASHGTPSLQFKPAHDLVCAADSKPCKDVSVATQQNLVGPCSAIRVCQTFQKCDGKAYAMCRAQLMADVHALVAGCPALSMDSASRTATRVATGAAADESYSATIERVTYAGKASLSDTRERLRLLISFGEHAREFISAETGLRLLQFLADPTAMEAAVAQEFDEAEAAMLLQLLQCCVQLQVCYLACACGRLWALHTGNCSA